MITKNKMEGSFHFCILAFTAWSAVKAKFSRFRPGEALGVSGG
jgi:hypothetical protein